MSNYQPLDKENLLIERDGSTENIHESFYNYQVLNVMDFDNEELNCESLQNMLKKMEQLYPARLAKMKEALERLHVYKYIDIRNLYYWFQNKMLYWDRISDTWEDPYENYFLKERFIQKDGMRVGADNNIPGVFGQSWTILEESDALWRIYSKEGRTDADHSRIFYGVRIETTVQKLLNIIYTDASSMANTWIGKVKYMTEKEINDTLCEEIGNFNRALGESFFNKRKEFEHELEFRFVRLMDSSTIAQTHNYKRIAFMISNIDNFIDSYVLDPRLSDVNYQILKEQLLSYGAASDKISKSTLYNFTPIEVKLN